MASGRATSTNALLLKGVDLDATGDSGIDCSPYLNGFPSCDRSPLSPVTSRLTPLSARSEKSLSPCVSVRNALSPSHVNRIIDDMKQWESYYNRCIIRLKLLDEEVQMTATMLMTSTRYSARIQREMETRLFSRKNLRNDIENQAERARSCIEKLLQQLIEGGAFNKLYEDEYKDEDEEQK